MFRRVVFLVISCCCLISCNGSSTDRSDSEAERIQLQSSMAVCRTLFQRLCLQTADNELFSVPIEGFNFVWGHTYELSLDVTEIEDPPADGSSIKYELVEIISDIEDNLGSTYVYDSVVLLDNTFTKESDVYFFLGQTFTCHVDCDSLVNMNNSGGLVNVTFEYIGNGEMLLVQWN